MWDGLGSDGSPARCRSTRLPRGRVGRRRWRWDLAKGSLRLSIGGGGGAGGGRARRASSSSSSSPKSGAGARAAWTTASRRRRPARSLRARSAACASTCVRQRLRRASACSADCAFACRQLLAAHEELARPKWDVRRSRSREPYPYYSKVQYTFSQH